MTSSKLPKKGDGNNPVKEKKERCAYLSWGSGLVKYSKRRDLQLEILPLWQPTLKWGWEGWNMVQHCLHLCSQGWPGPFPRCSAIQAMSQQFPYNSFSRHHLFCTPTTTVTMLHSPITVPSGIKSVLHTDSSEWGMQLCCYYIHYIYIIYCIYIYILY